MGECLYIPFWKKQLPFIKETIISGRTSSKVIDIAQLQSCSREGNRTTLRFRVSIEHGVAATNTNSAIARDLCEVLNSSDEIAEIAKDKKVVIHLIRGNQLELEVI